MAASPFPGPAADNLAVFARIYRRATKMVAAGFLKSLIRTVSYKIHIVLTDNGVQFAHFERGSGLIFPHIFGRVAQENGIEQRLTKPYHPWTHGQPNAWCAPSRKRPD